MSRTPFAHILTLIVFIVNSFGPIPMAQAQELVLPKPGVMVHLSPPMNPPMLKGIKVHTDNPFRFDFILDKGDSAFLNLRGSGGLKEESAKLIKYFLASLTIPEKDLWVNLSPYEKDRIVPESFGVTEMGRDLLAQDYMLKQITASLIYPEDEVGKKFWKRIYEEAQSKYHTTNIPVNTFNKVWIVPEKAVVYENEKAGTAYVVESKLKVMLEADYLSMSKNVGAGLVPAQDNRATTRVAPTDINQIGSQIVREIVIPELTKEINEGKNFSQLRQVYNSLILATWYKKKIKDSILSKVYVDKSKTQGINIEDPQEKEKIYQQYLKAFKKGVYNYIKEEVDHITQQPIPRKYFSGGFTAAQGKFSISAAMTATFDSARVPASLSNAAMVSADITNSNKAMLADPAMPADDQMSVAPGQLGARTVFARSVGGVIPRLVFSGTPRSVDPRYQVIDQLKQIIGEGKENLIADIITFLDSQENQTKTMSYLPPNLFHVQRALKNADPLLNGVHFGFKKKIQEELGVSEEQARNIALAAVILLKIGYGEKPKVEDADATRTRGQKIRQNYWDNRSFALAKIDELSTKGLFEALGLVTPEQQAIFKEAIQRAGEYGAGPQYEDVALNVKREQREKKYSSSLTSFLTLATDLDIGRERLQDWQKSQIIMDSIFRVLFNPEIRNLYIERTKLEVELRNPNRTRNKIDISAEIDRNKSRFNKAIERRIKEEIIAQKSKLVGLMVKKEGIPEILANEIFSHLESSIDSINSETYLWIISSYFIKDVRISEEGTIDLDFYADQIPLLGAAVNLEHIRRFHIDRLRPTIKEINEKQGLRIQLIERQVREDQQMYEAIQAMLKAENHAHAKMSVDFNFIWKILLGENIVQDSTLTDEELQKAVLDELVKSEKKLQEMRTRAGLPSQEIELSKLVGDIHWALEGLEQLILRIRNGLGNENQEFTSKESMVEEARNILVRLNQNGGIPSVTGDDKVSLNKLIELYDRLKTEIRDLYNFRSGALTSFVFHFMATSTIFKAISDDEGQALPAIVLQVLKKNQESNVASTEQRFNIGSYEQTRGEILTFLQAYIDFKKKEKPSGGLVSDLILNLSITKFDDRDKSFEERERHKIESARVLVRLMDRVVSNITKGKIDQEFEDTGLPRGHGITNRMLLEAGLNMDAAGQEEWNEPQLFFEAFRLYEREVGRLNGILEAYYQKNEGQYPADQRIYFNQGGLTSHVSESITDVSPETGMINTPRMLFMDNIDENFDWTSTKPILSRLGHSILPWLYDYDQFLGKEIKERVSERIKMVKTAISLLRQGVPLLNPTLKELPQDQPLDIQGSITALRAELAELASKDPNEDVTYRYTAARVQDLKTMAGFIRDVLIKQGTVVETNPTSNVGVSPYIPNYDTHTVKQLLGYRYANWIQSQLVKNGDSYTYAGRAISKEDGQRLAQYRLTAPSHNRARFTINTDDLTLFGTDLNEEIYRIAIAQGLTIGQVAQVVQEWFDSRFSRVPLTKKTEIRAQYIRNTLDNPYESLEQMLEELPEGIAAKLETAYNALPAEERKGMVQEISAAREMISKIEEIYQGYMMAEDAQGQPSVKELIAKNYHNFLHNLMVTFSALKLTENAGIKRGLRDLKVVFLAALLHDFHVRFVTVKDRPSDTPALVEETIFQLEDLLMGQGYSQERTSRNNSAYSLRLKDDQAFKESFRQQVEAFLGNESLSSIWPEVKALILRTDFASDVAPPAFAKEDTGVAVKVRQDMENIIEQGKASDESIGEAIMLVSDLYQQRIDVLEDMPKPVDEKEREVLDRKVSTSKTWLERQRSIELSFLEGLRVVSESRRFMVYQLAIRLEMSDQSASGWMGTERVAESITQGLKNEIPAVGLEGNYPFFYKPQLLSPRALYILKDLPLVSKINFYRNMEYFAHLSKQFGGDKDWEGDGNKPGFKNEVLVSLGLYIDQRGKIVPISSKTNTQIMLALVKSSFGQTLSLWQLHAMAIHPSVSLEQFLSDKDQYIFREGEMITDPEANEDIYLIVQGSADIFDKERFLVQRKPGELVGEIGAVLGGPRTAAVKVGKGEKSTQLLRIPRALFQGVFIANNSFRKIISDVIRERMTRSNRASELNEDRLNLVDMQLTLAANGQWQETELTTGQSKKIGIQFYSQINEIAQGVMDYLGAINETHQYPVDIPQFKMIAITKAGRPINVYQDPTDGQLILAVSYKLFEGSRVEIIKRIGWALYHQLLYLSAKVPRTTDRQQQILEESVLLLRDLLADLERNKIDEVQPQIEQEKKNIAEAIDHLNFLIQKTEGDDVLNSTLKSLKGLYVIFITQRKINKLVIDTLLRDVFATPTNDPEFMSTFLLRLRERGIKYTYDQTPQRGNDPAINNSAMTADQAMKNKDPEPIAFSEALIKQYIATAQAKGLVEGKEAKVVPIPDEGISIPISKLTFSPTQSLSIALHRYENGYFPVPIKLMRGKSIVVDTFLGDRNIKLPEIEGKEGAQTVILGRLLSNWQEQHIQIAAPDIPINQFRRIKNGEEILGRLIENGILKRMPGTDYVIFNSEGALSIDEIQQRVDDAVSDDDILKEIWPIIEQSFNALQVSREHLKITVIKEGEDLMLVIRNISQTNPAYFFIDSLRNLLPEEAAALEETRRHATPIDTGSNRNSAQTAVPQPAADGAMLTIMKDDRRYLRASVLQREIVKIAESITQINQTQVKVQARLGGSSVYLSDNDGLVPLDSILDLDVILSFQSETTKDILVLRDSLSEAIQDKLKPLSEALGKRIDVTFYAYPINFYSLFTAYYEIILALLKTDKDYSKMVKNYLSFEFFYGDRLDSDIKRDGKEEAFLLSIRQRFSYNREDVASIWDDIEKSQRWQKVKVFIQRNYTPTQEFRQTWEPYHRAKFEEFSTKDLAMKGGIDFTANKTPLEIQNGGQGIEFKMDPIMLKQLQNAPGFTPVIINIQPLTDLKGWLGINKGSQNTQQEKIQV